MRTLPKPASPASWKSWSEPEPHATKVLRKNRAFIGGAVFLLNGPAHKPAGWVSVAGGVASLIPGWSAKPAGADSVIGSAVAASNPDGATSSDPDPIEATSKAATGAGEGAGGLAAGFGGRGNGFFAVSNCPLANSMTCP